MQKSIVHLVTELNNLLLAFGPLVTLFERKQPQALPQLMSWLQGSEQLLSSYGIVLSAQLAGFRSKLIQPLYHDEHRGGLRKQQLKQAVTMLYDVQDCLQQAIQPHQLTLQQSRDLIRQLLSILRQSGQVHYDANAGFETFVLQIWQLINQHDQLKAGAVQLRSKLSQQDVLLLLAQEINPADFLA